MTRDEIRDLPDDIRPISMWGYFGYQILNNLAQGRFV